MSKSIGYSHTDSRIKKISFRKRGKIILKLLDGREVLVPLERFPEIRDLTPAQKRRYKLLAGKGLMFEDVDSVYHVSDFLGQENLGNELSMVAEKNSPYRKYKS